MERRWLGEGNAEVGRVRVSERGTGAGGINTGDSESLVLCVPGIGLVCIGSWRKFNGIVLYFNQSWN